MKGSRFACCGDISRGNTLVWWSEPAGLYVVPGPFAPIYMSRSSFPDRRSGIPSKIERGFSPVRNRAWIISHFCRAIEAKVADHPRSFSRREIFHSRTFRNPRSRRAFRHLTASVSICNSKLTIPPLPVTDRDVLQRPHLLSRSVTARPVILPYLLQIETFPRDAKLNLNL